MTKSSRLTQDDWIAAGFRGLAEQGPGALNVIALAKVLTTTKGSFYWHFKDLPAFKAAMLGLWKQKVATEIMVDVADQPEPWARFEALVEAAAKPAPEVYGGRKIEPAMRAWALSDARVAEALAELDALRLGFIRQLLADIGRDDPALAELVYGAYIGTDDLAAKGRADAGAALRALAALLR